MAKPKLQLRQKILLTLTFSVAAILLTGFLFGFLSDHAIDVGIFLFSLGIPLLLLTFETLLDLNKWHVFRVWLTIGLGLAILSIAGHSDYLRKFYLSSSASSLKSLLIFLLVYWLLNKLLLATTGKYIINTFKQTNWYNHDAGRRIFWYDVLINILLFITILASSLLGL
ncbi:hypothetical protein DRJ53_16235 [Paracnuella aquatica]|nr:hypothetical protein DRJ53_16235 [Paracnuella aquatica]